MVDTWRNPPNWPAISRRIRARDGWCCRWCGAGDTLFHPRTLRPVLLTTMHLDRDPSNNEDWNLVCACRSCHVACDVPDQAVARAQARVQVQRDAGQLDLVPDLL